MAASTQTTFYIRPDNFDDLADLDVRGRWKLYRFPVMMHRVIVTVDSQGTLAGFCAFEVEQRSREFSLYAMESHQQGAGRDLINGVTERASRIVADSVR